MHKRRKFSQIERDFIAHRAHGCCEYCQIPHDFSPDTFEIEHIISLFQGGTNELSNLAFSCSGCNSRKCFKIMAIDPMNGANVNYLTPEQIIGTNIFNGKRILRWSKVLHLMVEQLLNY